MDTNHLVSSFCWYFFFTFSLVQQGWVPFVETETEKILSLIPQNLSAHVKVLKSKRLILMQSITPLHTLQNLWAARMVLPCNDGKLFGESNQMIDSLVNDIDEANNHCHILSYIMLDITQAERLLMLYVALQKRGHLSITVRFDGLKSLLQIKHVS